ncbi:MAG: betaine/proline/choline family ABC transporter ATP-binding protein [Chloroflexota bacterium]|nr:betaine/proline/choline family ABC transporter ATP-binding protein [Chloroflexota bacterium]
MPGSGAVVEFEHVTKRYGEGPPAVDDLSLRVPGGEVCVLVGPSGCGKTTTMKMVNRLVEPTSGRVTVDGRCVMDLHPVELRRQIGYVIQQVGLFPHLTVGANVGVVPRLLGWPRARIRERSEELLELVGLDPATYRDRYPAELSGGERQRVGVARALAADPPLLLMDEPFGAVDPIRREQLQNQLLRLQQTLRKTILFVTHDVDEAIKMADRLAILRRGGVLAQYDTPDAVLARPNGDFVERFVGADRGLKRLSLVRVRDVALLEPVIARPGEPAVGIRRRLDDANATYALVVDDDERPVGWVAAGELRDVAHVDAARATPIGVPVEPESTLRDALSAMLATSVQMGVVIDPRGRVAGTLSIDTIGDILRESERSTEAAPGA